MMMFSMTSNMNRLSTHHNNETTGAGERVPPQAHPTGGEGGVAALHRIYRMGAKLGGNLLPGLRERVLLKLGGFRV